MKDIIPSKKQSPILGLTGMGGGVGSNLGGSAAETVYGEDVFSTYLYKGTGSAVSVNNGIDLSGEGGMTWIKSRTDTHYHNLIDTVRGPTKAIFSNHAMGEDTATNGYMTSFNNNGFTTGTYNNVTVSGGDFTSWTFRKAKGFFDVVTYSGSGSYKTVSHNLGCAPGMYMIKRTDGGGGTSSNWIVHHKDLSTVGQRLILNTMEIQNSLYSLNHNTGPTSSVFSVGSDSTVNASGGTYVCYLFAGGESTAATARSVNFNGVNEYLSIADHADFDVGTNWTAECWFRADSLPGSYNGIFGQWSGSGTNGWVLEYVGTELRFYWANSGSYKVLGTVPLGQWHHVAISKQGTTTRIFLNGTQVVTDFDMGTISASSAFTIGGMVAGGGWFDGQISNVRIVQGTAVYTTAFKPSYEPLTNITNTKLLCCNNPSTTGSTVSPTTITDPNTSTAIIDSPFDDPDGFKFGEEGDQNMIKCGGYTGNGSSSGNEINLGWEPQWVLVKNYTNSDQWYILDSMRGYFNDSNDNFLTADNQQAETNYDFGRLTSTGFSMKGAAGANNANGNKYVYVAIRRPDGYVGKPVEAGTSVFNMIAGTSSADPTFVSGFPVDFAIQRKPAITQDWYTGVRITGNKNMRTNTTAAETSSGSSSTWRWDYQNGWHEFNADQTANQSWMWKRHAGFDVQRYTGKTGQQSRVHGLNAVPEMIWVKSTNNAYNWAIGHKDLTGGWTSKHLRFTNNAEFSGQQFALAPTSTHWTTVNGGLVNDNGEEYIAMLFASVEGISKVGSYDGQNSTKTITTGFQPRFVILKSTTDNTTDWWVLDTVRGWGSGDDKYMALNSDTAQGNFDFGAPTSTGFTLNTFSTFNAAGSKYIYYAHA